MPPKTFTPRPFQVEGVKFLLKHSRCALFVDMGLGKTVMVLTAIQTLLDNNLDDGGDFLIVAPAFVAKATWNNEAKKWAHLANIGIASVTGDKDQRLRALKSPCKIKVINYENLDWLVKTCDKLGKWPFTTVVFDESTRLRGFRGHYRVNKDANGVSKRALYRTSGSRACAIIKPIFRYVKQVWLLTGTPCQNSLGDLWGQFFFLDGGVRLGSSYSSFEGRWFDVDRYSYKSVPKEYAQEQITSQISDVTFTLRAKDYMSLADETVIDIPVELPQHVKEQYDSMEREFIMELIENGDLEVFHDSSKLMKCRQIANGTVYFDDKRNFEQIHKEKIIALESVVEAANGTPILVAYWFKADLEVLQKHFPKGRFFDGKPNTYKDFAKGKIPLLFIHPQSAGHGVDGLQHTTNIICFYSLDWNAEIISQAIGRIGNVRQAQAGYTRPTLIYRLIAKDTIDESLAYCIDNKVSVEDAVKERLARLI